MLDKIAYMREIIEKCGAPIDLEVDGGVKAENAAAIKEAGANVLVAGSAIFGARDYKKIIHKLRAA
jgi:ribulose-phosphate 3-epimerase